MARVSRKQFKNKSQETVNIKSNIYLAAIYLRISSKESKFNDGNSIKNQKELLLNFVKQREDIIVKKIYCDNGKTGTNFDRPQWNILMKEVEIGSINCIIVKDLSRLGRSYLEVGNYLSNIFPKFNIKFIAVNDCYDTSKSNTDSDDIVIIMKNIFNDMYSKDISQKIFLVKKLQRENGKFTGNIAPYGYIKDINDKYHLVINNETAPIVIRIFKLKLQGKTNTEICKILNSENIPSPYKYLYNKGKVTSQRYANTIWKRETINIIIRNEMYIGNMVQGKRQQCLVNGKTKAELINKNDYVIVSNTHSPIIDKETFFKVQEICKKNDFKNDTF